MRNNIFFKQRRKRTPKRRVKKKNEKPFFKSQKNKTWKINEKKDVQTKTSILGTEENRKREFCRSLQGYKNLSRKVIDTENKDTIKEQEQIFKRAEKGWRTEKTRRDNK